MCGIVGLYKHNIDKISSSELDYFTDSLSHRGPDGRGIFINPDRNVGLGHRRLAILDTSESGSQPMSCINGRYQIVFNGEIYNFIELKKELKNFGYKFNTNTDTEIILASYDKWGENCQMKFNGMWAFAIWDSYKKEIFLSRDRFGSKPIYYLTNKNYFVFASELKAFFHLNSKIKPELNYNLIRLIKLNNYETNETILKNVKMLSSGHQINFNCKLNILDIKKWWKTDENLIKVPKTYDEQVEEFKRIFIDACKIRLRSDVPVATSLSGGLDSSSVCSTINYVRENNDNTNQRISKNSYSSFIFDVIGHKDYDKLSEIPVAKEVLKNIKSKNYFIEFDNLNKIDPEDLAYKSEDVEDSLIGPYLIYRKMSETGHKVSIDGHGADELLGGYHDYVDYALKDVEYGLSNDNFQNIYQIMKHNNKESKINFKQNIRFLLGHITYKNLKKFLNIIKLKKEKQSKYYFKKFIENKKNKKFNNLDQALYLSFHGGHLQSILNRFDKISMCSGVESRSPFLDWRLVTYCFSIPSTNKIGRGYTKLILRESMKGLVPEKVRLRRDKFGFRMPKRFEKFFFKEYVYDNLYSKSFQNIDLIDTKKFLKKLETSYNYTNYKHAFRFVQMANILKKFSSIKKLES